MFVLATTRFGPQFFSTDILSNVNADYLASFLYDTVFNKLFQMAACVYIQWSNAQR